MIDQIELKNMHSKELRILRNMIREELDFRADIGSEIDERKREMRERERRDVEYGGSFEHMVTLTELRGGQ